MTDKSVQVAVRVRPLVPSEKSKGCDDVIEVFSEINQVKIKNSERAFTYNYVFNSKSTQKEVYENCVRNMLSNLFKGYNLTILAYGQTGSGKTHTMGTLYTEDGDLGVIPRAVAEIFDHIRDNFTYDYTVTVSYMELYQEVLYDLLNDKSREQCVLEIREDNKSILIPGLTEIPVQNTTNVLDALIKGSKYRATGATNMNAQSSRSHAIFTLNLMMQSKNDDSNTKTAKFHFVDLAGSERSKKTGAVGTTFKEGVNINKGLLALGNVISALGDEKQQHGYIPYRDSNLTRLLRDSLGGNSITLMIACISPADYNVEETLSTLRYADRARKIQNKPIVNQDPKAAEINKLKKVIQDLKLQIVGQGGPIISSEEITALKEQNHHLQIKIRDLTLQLSSTLSSNTGLMEKIIILQTANENLHKKVEELKNEYNITLNNINASFEQNDHELLKKNVGKLQELQKQFAIIDEEQKNTENEIHNHEQIIDLHNSESGQLNDDLDISKDQEIYTNQQIALTNELQEVTKNLAMKEHLAKQITINTQYMVDYKAMAENQDKIMILQKEKDKLMQQLKNAHVQGPSGKIAEQRRKRVQELESQLHDLNRKVQEQARLIKLKEKDELKIGQLNREILQMKQARVQLIKKIREESERFRAWKIQRERELAKLKQQDRKKQNQIVKMEVMHSKQQNVLKRKVEEAVALNRRLKDALALRRITQDAKHNEKSEKMGHWIKQEFAVQLHLIEAEATLAGLLEDRAMLQSQLDKLKDNPESTEEQIKSIEEDIELRSVQIQDLQQKILDSDDENRKSKFDNLQTMAETKFALKTVLEQTVEIKKSEVAMKSKLIEAQASQNELVDKTSKLEKIVRMYEYKHAEGISNLQKDYEEKIAVLLRQLRGVEVQDGNEELKQRCAIQTEKIDELDKKTQDLMNELFEKQKQIKELTKKIDTITEMAKKGGTELKPDTNSDYLDESESIETKKNRTVTIKKEIDSTFVIDNQENIEASFEEETDDIEKDPDWKRTPLGKWLIEKRKRISHKNGTILDFTNKLPMKRTSDGGCMCSKGNCSKRCGCRKVGKICTAGCKCSSTLCTNREDEQDSTNGILIEKKPRMLKETTNSHEQDCEY